MKWEKLTDVMQHNAEYTIMLDPMAPPSPCIGVSSPSHATDSGGEQVFSLNGNGTVHGTESHETRAPESYKFESQSIASEEETDNNLSKMKTEHLEEEERAPELPVDLKQENNFELESSSPLAPAPDAPQEESAEKPSQELEQEAVVQTQETDKLSQELEQEAVLQAQERAKMQEEEKDEEEEAPAELNLEKQEDFPEVPDVMDVVKQDEIPAASDEQQQEIQGGEVMKQEVAHRSHILGSLSKLDENSARQLLNDSGWNVSQSVRMNGKTQWYYRSPPPKPVLMGSLTSAVAMWKRLVDEEHKRKGGGDDDLYPMVTAFLNNVKRPASKKRKRGRYTD